MRLTQKNESFEYVLPEQNIVGDTIASEISLGDTEYTCKKYVVGSAIKKLGEIENILETFCIDDLGKFIDEQLKEHRELDDEVYELKQKIEKLEPKYEKGQMVYFIDDYGQILPGVIIGFDVYTLHYIITNPFNNEVWKGYSEVFAEKKYADLAFAKLKGNKVEKTN